MALNASGPISIGGSTTGQSINLEFARAATATTSMSQLYRNGGIVGAGAPNVPTSGPISLSQFYSAANQFIYTISSNQTNLNLRTGAIAAGWDQNAPLVVTINSGVYVSSNATGTPALTVTGSFPGGINLTNNGFIVGMGGAGGGGGSNYHAVNPTVGGAGATALSTTVAMTVTNNGTIAGGGGGGGGGGGTAYFASDGKNTYYTYAFGAGGGGGRSSAAANASGGQGAAWRVNGSNTQPTNNGSAGTVSAAGAGGVGGPTPQGGNGGAGGGWGAAGTAGANGVDGGNSHAGAGGGAAGAAVSGNSNITWVATGTRLGAIA